MNMNIRHMAISAAAGLLALVGCQSGMYSTDVSVERRAGGVSDYTVVPSLPDGDIPASMPVVVESKSTTEKGDHAVNNLLWFVTLGVVPGVTSEATVYDVTVRTPLGERSGTCTVEASSWFGWLPIFLPYPGVADERVADPKLPNAALAKKARDRLVENLVSQFPKEEYAGYAAKNNSPEEKAKRAQEAAERERVAKERAEAERIRQAKEAEERRLALHGKLAAEAVTNDLAQIRERYSKGRRYQNPFLGEKGRNRDEKSDWLAHWASPRLPLAETDAQAGEAALSEFGAKYLPNAYANYEKRREALAEIQQMFKEEFPQPWTIKETNSKWNSFNRVLERFSKARTEAFLCHDELCHYWLLWRLGVLSDKDFAAIDAKSLSVWLLPENVARTEPELVPLKPLEGNVAAFAAKYAPASNGIYQRMAREFKETDALLSEVFGQRRQMDDVRYSRALAAAVDKRNALARELNALSFQLQTWYMDHRTMEKTADDVARCDADMSKKLKPFLDSLPAYVKERTLGPVIADAELVAIPGKGLRMQRTEVTQLQWLFVMGSNPSRFCGLDRPVENVSWNDCQEFVRRASEMDGRRYRLPTEKEWEYACRAESTTDWGKRANGECGPLDAMGWYRENSGGETHPVAQKEPNAWGLYDMHGNVWEWCQGLYGSGRSDCVGRGGGWNNGAGSCSASDRRCSYPDCRNAGVGFRLVVCQNVIEDTELVVIPGRNYRLQRTEVTQRQWESVMEDNPSRFRGLDRPVENVSWNDCQEFIKRVSALDGRRYRLPTEEEWEYVCRAGGGGSYGRRGLMGAMGWYRENSGGETHPVAQKEPNAWGLYDMHGNVREWCQDEAGNSGRVYQGDGWRNGGANNCWNSCKGGDVSDRHHDDLGFRLVSED